MGSFSDWLIEEGLMDSFMKPEIKNPVTVCIELPQMDQDRFNAAKTVLDKLINTLGGRFRKSQQPNTYFILVPDQKSAKYLAAHVKNGIVIQDKLPVNSVKFIQHNLRKQQ